jgi:dihydroflavonol-4-reductase
MGAGDVYPTPSGKLVLDIVKKKIPACFDGAIDVVDVDDVAAGHLLALEKGEAGQSYNLGNPDNYVTMKSLFTIIAEESGVKPPALQVPLPLVMLWAQAITLIADYITHRQPLVTPGSIQVLSLKRRIDFSRAICHLGLPQTPLRTTIRKTINWYRTEGYL